MGVAETAVVAVELKLNGVTAYTSGIAKAEAATASLNKTSGGITGAVKSVESGIGKLSGALGHAGNQIKGLVTGPLGFLGLTAGIFTLGGAIKDGITKASDFGMEVFKLQAITGGSADQISALASAFDHFNISSDTTVRSLGLLEKNVGLLQNTVGGVAKFQKDFGLAIADSNGHVKDANALILTAADYFNNKLIPAQTKDAALAKLFGRSWQELIPILAAGSKGITDAEQAAKDLGLTLTQTNINDLAKFRDSTRELGSAFGGLELQVGLALVPALKDLADNLTRFVSQHRTDIVQFFKDGAKWAQDMGKVIQNDVLPVFRGIADAWNKVPQGLKDLLVTGFVANKTSKFLFDFGIGDLAKGAGSIFSRGGNPLTPLFVQDVSGIGGAASGLGLGSATALGFLALLPVIAAELVLLNNHNPYKPPTTPTPHGLPPGNATSNAANAGQQKWVIGPDGRWVVVDANGNIVRANSGGQTVGVTTPKLTGSLTQPGLATDPEAIARLREAASAWDTQSEKTGIRFAAAAEKLAEAGGLMAKEFLDHIGGKSGVANRSLLKFGKTPHDAQVDATFQRDLIHSAGMIAKSSESNDRKLADLKVLERSGNTATATAIRNLEHTITKNKPVTTVNVLLQTDVRVSGKDVTLEQRYRSRYGPVIQS